MTLAQQGECFSGTYTGQTRSGTGFRKGFIAGTINRDGVFRALLTFPDPADCPFEAAGNADALSLTGTYTAINCREVVVGDFSLSRL